MFLPVLSSLVVCLQAWPGAYPRGEHLKGTLFWKLQPYLQALDYAGKACQKQTHYLIMNIRKLKPQQKFYSISLRLNWLTDEKHSSLVLCNYNDNEKKFYKIDSRRTHRTTSNHTYEITSQKSSSVQN